MIDTASSARPNPEAARSWPYTQLDVFASERLLGNPLAVVHDADDLSEAQMQALARWTNLSETTFLLRPTEPRADYRVRIFTPHGELGFAGHPTLGSCQAWVAAGGRPQRDDVVIQQCKVGLVKLRRAGADHWAFEAPPLTRGAVAADELRGVMDALGASPAQLRAAQWLDNGTRWLGLLLDSAATVLALEPDHALLKRGPKVGVIGACAATDLAGGPDFEVRAFAASVGINEDPVTGSLNAGLAQWLMAEGWAPPAYTAAQGQRVGCRGRVTLQRESPHENAPLWVGGRVLGCISGRLSL